MMLKKYFFGYLFLSRIPPDQEAIMGAILSWLTSSSTSCRKEFIEKAGLVRKSVLAAFSQHLHVRI